MSIDEAPATTPGPQTLCDSPLARCAIDARLTDVVDTDGLTFGYKDSCAFAAAALADKMSMAIDGVRDVNDVATYFSDINRLTRAGVPVSNAARRDEVVKNLNLIRKQATARLAGWTVRHDEYSNPMITGVLAALAARLK